MRFLAVFILFTVLFTSVGPTASAQFYQPQPVLTAVTGPSCPQVAGLQTAPTVHLYGVCAYSGGRANVTVPAGLVLRWRYYVPVWWWPFYQQEVTAFAYPGQTVQTDWFEVYYSPPYLIYTPGVPIYQPPPTTQPPTWPSPMPGLPAPGTPAPSETRTGVGITLAFAAGWPVAGWQVRYAFSGRTAYQCYVVTTEAGWLTDGIINPVDGIARHAPGPCYFP